MTIIETNVESILQGDRISFNRDSEPRRVLARALPYGSNQTVWILYDEAGAPSVHKLPGTTVFVHIP